MTAEAARLAQIVDGARRALACESPEFQAAILADLVAIWLASHHVAGDAEATRKMRASLLAEHCAAVRELTSVNAEIMETTP